MKVSVCITLLNEEKSIGKLLESLSKQTKLPDEVVIVDGGSTDNTIKIIKSFKKGKLNINLFVVKNASRSKGRNVSVAKSKNEITAIMDADCAADKYWLERITKPFEKSDVMMVAGFYKMVANTPFQKALAPFLGVTADKFKKDFLPSTRSIAFTKTLWKEVGGFPETNGNTAEDTIFNYKVVKNKSKIVRAKNAVVYWEVPDDLGVALKKFYNYAKWDAEYGIWWHPTQKFRTHNLKVLTIFLRYAFFLIFGWFFFLLYLLWAIYKLRKSVREWNARIYVVIIQVASDFAIMAGFLSGIWVTQNK